MTTDTQILVLFAIGLAGLFLIAWAVAETIVQRRAEARFQAAIPKFTATVPKAFLDPAASAHFTAKAEVTAVPPPNDLSIFPKGERVDKP